MLMIDNIKNYLYDKKYFINLFENYIHVFNYLSMDDFTRTKVVFSLSNFKVIIHGNNFLITKMLHNEILIKGDFLSLEKIDE